MRTRMHPLSKAVYDVREDGLVEVTQGDRRGIFTANGVRAIWKTFVPRLAILFET